MERPSLRGAPECIFISVDESIGTSTVSFSPAEVGAPFQLADDRDGARALTDAKAIVARYPTCTIHGPHFHAARPPRAKVRKRG
jgi:hypothetical protein